MAKEALSNGDANEESPSHESPGRPKVARGLLSGSPVLENAYQRFIADVFARDIRTVVRHDDTHHRRLVLAGAYRISINKRSGLISTDLLKHDANSNEFWKLLPLKRNSIDLLLGSRREWGELIAFAWSTRFRLFTPAAIDCFADKTATDNFALTPDQSLSHYVERAARRRLGGTNGASLAAGALAKAMWSFILDPTVAKLTLAYFGKSASLRHYNFAVRRFSELAARQAETPALTSLMGEYIETDPKLMSGRFILPPDILILAREKVLCILGGQQLAPAAWRYLSNSSSPTVRHVVMLARGATSRGMWAIRMQNGWDDSKKDAHSILSLLAGVMDRPPHSFAVWLCRMDAEVLNAQGEAQQESLQRFVRLAGREAILAARKKRLKNFLKGDLQLALDWFSRSCIVPRDREIRDREFGITHQVLAVATIPRNATWSSLMRSQRQWHADRESREAAQRAADQQAYEAWLRRQDALTWISAVGTVEINGVTVRPWTTGNALRLEGDEMSHCVATYASTCHDGRSRIFHATGNGEDATVEIELAGCGQSWRVRQVFGYDNARASEAMWTAAKRLAKLYSVTKKQPTSKGQVIPF